jgi:hypothetical protein
MPVSSSQYEAAMVKPDSNGSPLLPKRTGPKTLVSSSWLDRTVLLIDLGLGEYVENYTLDLTKDPG